MITQDWMDLDGVRLSSFIKEAATKGLNMGKLSTDAIALGWRIQRQYDETSEAKAALTYKEMSADLQSYLVGCQVMNLMKQLEKYHTQSILLLFDIFANGLEGADKDLGPSPPIRRYYTSI